MKSFGIILAILVGSSAPLMADVGHQDIIGGQRANETDFKDVVRVNCGRGFTSGTIVGYRTVLIPAHAKHRGEVKCKLSLFDGSNWEFIARDLDPAPLGNERIDLAFGVTDRPMLQIVPALIGRRLAKGNIVAVVGFGCTLPGGRGSIGALHAGNAEVFELSKENSEFNFGTKGSALCFGDSGSPAYSFGDEGEPLLVGIGASSNVKDTSWYVNLTNSEIRRRLYELTITYSLEICGVNSMCEAWSH